MGWINVPSHACAFSLLENLDASPCAVNLENKIYHEGVVHGVKILV